MAPLREQIRDVVVNLLSGWLKTVVEKGLLRALAALVLVVVILPPVLVLVAAFWLKVMGTVNLTLVRAVRDAYLDVIEKGFSVDEMAARSNVRLDYLQTFEYDLKPLNPKKVLHLSLSPWQKTSLIFRTVGFTADGLTCTLPESDPDLVVVSLGDQVIRTLSQDANVSIPIGKQWWHDHAPHFGDDDSVERLSFSLTDKVRTLPCGRVHIEGTVEVFKDLLQRPEP